MLYTILVRFEHFAFTEEVLLISIQGLSIMHLVQLVIRDSYFKPTFFFIKRIPLNTEEKANQSEVHVSLSWAIIFQYMSPSIICLGLSLEGTFIRNLTIHIYIIHRNYILDLPAGVYI